MSKQGSSKVGVLSYKQKDKHGHSMYQFRISDYHAAMILQYIAKIPHKPEPPRDKQGKFKKGLL